MNFWALKRRIHPCWLIAIVCLGFSLGIFLAEYYQFQNTYILIMVIIFVAVGIWKRWVALIPLIIIGGLMLGIFRGSLVQFELARYKSIYGQTVLVSGIVKEDVDIGGSDQLVVKLGGVSINNKTESGVLWITVSTDKHIKRSDRLLVKGKIMKGFGNFAGVIYRAKLEKISEPETKDFALAFRDWFSSTIRKSIPEPEASLGIGFLVGQRSALPADLVDVLKLAGLTHIVVASGYNLTILVRLARRLFEKISKYMATLSATIMIIAFIAITGISPSMTRAGLVSGLSLAAWYYGRKFHPIVLLMIAIAITLIINPSYAWGDIGWLLSFAAFAGVMILSPLMQRYFFDKEKPGFVMQILCETVSAQIVTAPILIVTFGQISNVAIISNLLILPFVPFAMLFVFIAGVGSIIISSLSTIFGLPAYLLLKCMTTIARYLAELPWAINNNITISWSIAIIIYTIIIAVCLYMSRVTKYNLRDANLVE